MVGTPIADTGGQDLNVESGALVLARSQLGVDLLSLTRHQGTVQDVVAARGELLGGDEVAVRGTGDQLGQGLDSSRDGRLGHVEQLADGSLGQVVAQVDQRRLQRPGLPENRRDGVQRSALGDPLGRFGDLVGARPSGTLHVDNSSPHGAFV